MKQVLLSTDGKAKVYMVLDKVAEKLFEYCSFFSRVWIHKEANKKNI